MRRWCSTDFGMTRGSTSGCDGHGARDAFTLAHPSNPRRPGDDLTVALRYRKGQIWMLSCRKMVIGKVGATVLAVFAVVSPRYKILIALIP